MFVFPKFHTPNIYKITPVIKVKEFPPPLGLKTTEKEKNIVFSVKAIEREEKVLCSVLITIERKEKVLFSVLKLLKGKKYCVQC